MSEIVLKMCNINKCFNNFVALNNVNITLEKGKIYGFIGKNGAGKTTLMRIISGMSEPTSGNIELFGVKQEKDICIERKKLGVMINDCGISPDLTAKENLTAQMIIKGLKDIHRIDEVLNIVDLVNTGSKKYKDFSLGMKKRLCIATMLLSKPEFLILDEPTNGLDPVGIKDIRDLLIKINKEEKTTIMISSHILRELYEIATDYIFIDNGKILSNINREQLDKKLEYKIIIRSPELSKIEKILIDNDFKNSINVDKEKLVITGSEIDENKLIHLIHESGAIIEELSYKNESLESYFISLIGGEHND